MSMASHGHPSRKAPSGPLLVHSLHPIHRMGSTSILPNGGFLMSGIQYMQSSTGQYSTHAGEPAQPVQHSLITAMMCGLRLRGVVVPVDLGSRLTTLPVTKSSTGGKELRTIGFWGVVAMIPIFADAACLVNRAPLVPLDLSTARQ